MLIKQHEMTTARRTCDGFDRQGHRLLAVRTPDDIAQWAILLLHQAGASGNVALPAIVP